MNMKVVGGSLCVLALVAIFFLHGRKHEAPAPAPVVIAEPVIVPLPTPAPVKVAPKPVSKKVVVGPPLKIAPAVPATKKEKQPDMSLSCRAARAVVAGKTPAQLQEMREQYGTSDEEIARYKHCF